MSEQEATATMEAIRAVIGEPVGQLAAVETTPGAYRVILAHVQDHASPWSFAHGGQHHVRAYFDDKPEPSDIAAGLLPPAEEPAQ